MAAEHGAPAKTHRPGPPRHRQKKFQPEARFLLPSQYHLCFYSSVTDANKHSPASQPDPDRAMPPRIRQVLGVVRMLIAYGKNLAETLEQHASQPHTLPCFRFIATIFFTKDIALILARIKRGLLRAAALEDRLRNRAATGRDIRPRRARPRSERKPRTACATPSPAFDWRLPSIEQIANQVKRRSIGAVLVDICLDLGVIPGQMDPASWNELGDALAQYGGDLSNLLVWRQPRPLPRNRPRKPRFWPVDIPGQTGMLFPPWPEPPPPPSPPLVSTGPP
jgi:hypothetical protein